MWASVVDVCGLSISGCQAPEHRLDSCGLRAQLPNQGSRLLHWQEDSSPLSYQESPKYISPFPLV